jgi:hypothetical protein
VTFQRLFYLGEKLSPPKKIQAYSARKIILKNCVFFLSKFSVVVHSQPMAPCHVPVQGQAFSQTSVLRPSPMAQHCPARHVTGYSQPQTAHTGFRGSGDYASLQDRSKGRFLLPYYLRFAALIPLSIVKSSILMLKFESVCSDSDVAKLH